MRALLTGVTGYIGSAVLEAFVRAGHSVTAIVRRSAAVEPLRARGITTMVAELGDPASYAEQARGFDAYVHAAFESSARGVDVDRAAVDTLLAAAGRSPGAVFVYTSGIWVLGPTTEPATEAAPVNPTPLVAFRQEHEQRVLQAGGDGVRTIVVRPGIVYGGSRGIISEMLKEASNGLMRVIGNGENHWPLVYDHDLADLYLKLATTPDAHGIYHGSDESRQTVNEIVEAIANHVPSRPDVRYMPIAEARQKLGPYADALALDQIVLSPRSRELGWTPSLPSFARGVPRLFEEWRSDRSRAAANS
jgi:nucleoside-diphosphate-sugar epimerase